MIGKDFRLILAEDPTSGAVDSLDLGHLHVWHEAQQRNLDAYRAGAEAPYKEDLALEFESVDAELASTLRADNRAVVDRRLPTALIRPFDGPECPSEEDEGFGWGLRAIGADRTNYTGKGIKVAVLDTGIDADHPAFSGMEGKIKAVDFTGGDDPRDVNGHGTHCAATIVGRRVGNTEVGVARGVEQLFAGKVLGDDGFGVLDWMIDGVREAWKWGAHVISLSLGFDHSKAIDEAVELGLPREQATDLVLHEFVRTTESFEGMLGTIGAGVTGPLIVAATGNQSRRAGPGQFYALSAGPPASVRGIHGVAALDRPRDPTPESEYSIAHFSNSQPRFSAPGVCISSAQAGSKGLTSKSGTSMATPHVAGVTALHAEKLVARDEHPTAIALGDSLVRSAHRLGKRSDFGIGMPRAPGPEEHPDLERRGSR